MKNLLLFIFLFISHFSLSQNLVNNWSFEDTISCPTFYGQIFKSVNWNAFRETPDYFNTCNNTVVGVPSNGTGFQLPYSGDAYVGIVTYSTFTINFREIIGAQLTQSLIIGQKYFISFFVCSGYSSSLNVSLFSNNIGVRFTTVPFSYSNPSPINNSAHFSFGSIISDTVNWIKISGSFVADSVYSYLSIGNFFNDSNTSISNLDTNIFNQFAFNYIDDVKVSTDSTFVNTAIKNHTNNVIKLFPNPARDWIVLEGKGIKSVEILNALGSEIGSYPTTAFTLRHQINFGTLSRGIYFLKINMIDNKFHFQKIIVQD